MADHSFNGRFRINSVNTSDLIPFCNGCSHKNSKESDSQRPLMNCASSNPLRYSGNSFDDASGVELKCLSHLNLNTINCPIIDSQSPIESAFNPNSVGNIVTSDFHSTSNIKIHSPKQPIHKHIDESLNSTRKLGKKEEIIVDTGPNGRFLKFSKEIGRGAFKTVYKGIDTETGVAIAWCEINNRRCTRDETVRFKREVEILKKLQHPNILRFYDFFSFTNRRGFVLITELMNAGTLRTYLSRFKSIPLRLIKNWCLQILRGLQFLHSRDPSIIHRDLKCDNIFINGANGSVKIGDLGLAVLSNSNARTVIVFFSFLTNGIFVRKEKKTEYEFQNPNGTPEFMAPEMYDEDYDESVDIWAFGLCVLEMYTLEYPYKECRCPAAIFKRVSNGIRPKALDNVEDQDLYNIIKSCTEKEKTLRVTIPMLLNHEFFQEQDIHMEEIAPITTDVLDPDIIRLLISREQKAITLDFNLEIDNPEKVVEELVSAGFAKHDEYQIFVKSLRGRIDKARRNKQINGTIVSSKDTSQIMSIETTDFSKNNFFKYPVKSDALFTTSDKLHFKEGNEILADIGVLGRISTYGGFNEELKMESHSISTTFSVDMISNKSKLKLTLSGLNGDKLVCFLKSRNTNLEFGFSLMEYSSKELVKNMVGLLVLLANRLLRLYVSNNIPKYNIFKIENNFILSSEQSQFVTQADFLIDLVQRKKLEGVDDESIVDSIQNFDAAVDAIHLVDLKCNISKLNMDSQMKIQSNLLTDTHHIFSDGKHFPRFDIKLEHLSDTIQLLSFLPYHFIKIYGNNEVNEAHSYQNEISLLNFIRGNFYKLIFNPYNFTFSNLDNKITFEKDLLKSLDNDIVLRSISERISDNDLTSASRCFTRLPCFPIDSFLSSNIFPNLFSICHKTLLPTNVKMNLAAKYLNNRLYNSSKDFKRSLVNPRSNIVHLFPMKDTEYNNGNGFKPTKIHSEMSDNNRDVHSMLNSKFQQDSLFISPKISKRILSINSLSLNNRNAKV